MRVPILVPAALIPATAQPLYGQALLSDLPQFLLSLLIVLVGIGALIALLVADGPQAEDSLAHWHATIPELRIPAERFLEALSLTIRRLEIPNAKISRVELYESRLLPITRTYLRVRKQRLNFYIFAAPLGKSFFVSSWLIEPRSIVAQVLLRFPLIGSLFARLLRRRQTLFAYDSALHFFEMSHLAVLEVTDMLTSKEGVVRLPDEQRKPIMRELYDRPQAPRLNL